MWVPVAQHIPCCSSDLHTTLLSTPCSLTNSFLYNGQVGWDCCAFWLWPPTSLRWDSAVTRDGNHSKLHVQVCKSKESTSSMRAPIESWPSTWTLQNPCKWNKFVHATTQIHAFWDLYVGLCKCPGTPNDSSGLIRLEPTWKMTD